MPTTPRPVRFTALIVLAIAVVTVASAAATTAFELPAREIELLAEALLAVLAATLLTRLHVWRPVGFRPLATPRDLRLFWVPLFPVLPMVPTAISGLGGIGLGRLGSYIALAGLVGFVEEVFFRGLILRSLAGRGVWRAAIVSSVLFGLLHTVNVLAGADPAASMVQVGYAAAMGFGFAAVTLRTGVIWPLVIIHALIDLTGFLVTDGTVATGLTSADVIVSAVYAVGFTVYGVIVLRTVRQPVAGLSLPDDGAVEPLVGQR